MPNRQGYTDRDWMNYWKSRAEKAEWELADLRKATPPEALTPMLCSQHGGYGFASDCRVCNAAPAGVPAKETSGDDQRNDAEVDGRAQPVKEAGSLVTGRECGTRSDAVCDEREVRKSGYDPRRDAAPVAWRWRNTTHWNPEAWSYGAQRPSGPGESVFIVEALYASPSPPRRKLQELCPDAQHCASGCEAGNCKRGLDFDWP